MKNIYSIQMFTMADVAKDNLKQALKQVSDLGYKQVEFAGFYGHSAEEVRKWLDEDGLTVSGAHVSRPEILKDFEGVVRFHKTIGNNVLIMPMEDLNSQEKLDQFTEDVKVLKPRLAKEGIELGYHNHLHEFSPNTDGTMIYEQVTSRTDLFLEVDVGWVNAAGGDPIEILNRFKDRIRFIHLRDSVRYNGQVTGVPMLDIYKDVFEHNIGKPLGQGTAPVDEAFQMAVANDWKMVIECEAKVPDGPAAAKLCMDYVKELESRYLQ